MKNTEKTDRMTKINEDKVRRLEIIKYIYHETGIHPEQINKVLNAFTKSFRRSMRLGEVFTLRGFGTFSVAERRVSNNLSEDKEIKVIKTIRFKKNQNLKKLINGRQYER